MNFATTNDISKKCAIYVRVSTEEQALKGLSLKAQEDKCKSFAEARGWQVHKIYKDAGFSAGSTERPAFQLMLRDAEELKYSIVLVHKIDRFSRRVKDLIDTLETLNSKNINFSSVSEQFDTTTAMGEAFFQIIGVFAQLERKTISERVILTFDKKIKDGQALHRAPLGYIYQNKRLIIDQPGSDIVKKIFEMRAIGVHYKAISEETKVPISTIYEIIKNPIYIGKIRYKNKLFKGIHQPIIDEKMWFYLNKKSTKSQTNIFNF